MTVLTAVASAQRPWLQGIPEHWRVVQLRHLADVCNGEDSRAVEAVEGPYAMYGSGGEFRRATGYLYDGESVLFGRKGTIDRPLHVSGRFWTVDTMFYTRLKPAVHGRFLYWYATTMPFSYYSTSTALPSITQGQLLGHAIPLPPHSEQRSIADYLDRETAQIDALISKQELLIETLHERRDADWKRIYESSAQEGPLLPVRRLITSITDGPFGSSLTSAHYVDSGVRVVRLGNIGINYFRLNDAAYISQEYAAKLSDYRVIAGDVVVAGLGDDRMPLGRAAVVPNIGPAIVKADCFRVRPGHRISSAYLAWALSAPPVRQQIRLLARGSTRSRLNTSVLREVRLRVPPETTQVKLLHESAFSLAKIDMLIAKAEQFIILARERRSALITAAVTGQIDVRAAS